MCRVLPKSNAKREKRQGKKKSNRQEETKIKNKCVESRKMNLVSFVTRLNREIM